MKRKLAIAAAMLAATWIVAGSALAAKDLFVKAKNTKVMASPAATAEVLAVLQPGETVSWLGAEPADKKWHKVTAKGKNGVVFQSNLSTTRPSTEVVASQGGKTVDAQAFASSGAATKALGEGPKEYAKGKDLAKAAADLEAAEGLAKKVTTVEIAAHEKKAGIFPVVGDK